MIVCPNCSTEIAAAGAVDDAAEWLHDTVHDQMQRQVELAGGWPSEVERLVYQNLDAALALFTAYLASLDEPDGEARERVH